MNFLLSNFAITGLFNSSANCWFNIFSLLTPLPEDFLFENVKTTEARLRLYSSYFGLLAILNALLCNTISEAVLLEI